jgi:hypothetical protein
VHSQVTSQSLSHLQYPPLPTYIRILSPPTRTADNPFSLEKARQTPKLLESFLSIMSSSADVVKVTLFTTLLPSQSGVADSTSMVSQTSAATSSVVHSTIVRSKSSAAVSTATSAASMSMSMSTDLSMTTLTSPSAPTFLPEPHQKPFNDSIVQLMLAMLVICGALLLLLAAYAVYSRCFSRNKCSNCREKEAELEKWRNGELKFITKSMLMEREQKRLSAQSSSDATSRHLVHPAERNSFDAACDNADLERGFVNDHENQYDMNEDARYNAALAFATTSQNPPKKPLLSARAKYALNVIDDNSSQSPHPPARSSSPTSSFYSRQMGSNVGRQEHYTPAIRPSIYHHTPAAPVHSFQPVSTYNPRTYSEGVLPREEEHNARVAAALGLESVVSDSVDIDNPHAYRDAQRVMGDVYAPEEHLRQATKTKVRMRKRTRVGGYGGLGPDPHFENIELCDVTPLPALAPGASPK